MPNRVPTASSPAYAVASSAVNKLLHESYRAGMSLLLPTDCWEEVLPLDRLYFRRVGLTLKKGTNCFSSLIAGGLV